MSGNIQYMDPMGFGGDMKSDELMEEFPESDFSEVLLLLICTVITKCMMRKNIIYIESHDGSIHCILMVYLQICDWLIFMVYQKNQPWNPVYFHWRHRFSDGQDVSGALLFWMEMASRCHPGTGWMGSASFKFKIPYVLRRVIGKLHLISGVSCSPVTHV